MSQLVNVVSTKRSGHHAFIEWYRRHHIGTTAFINNSPVGVLAEHIASHINVHSNPPLIVNYEGAMPASVNGIIDRQKRLCGDIKSIVFLRDPLNLAASLIHRKKALKANIVMILRQILAEYHWLLDRQTLGSDFLHVSYNSWLLDDHYRAEVANRLGLSSYELSNSITPEGGGSSFSSETELTESERRKLTTRWHGYRGHRIFEAIVSHPAYGAAFSAAYSGSYTDSFGGGFADDEAASYYERITRQRRPMPILDGLIERLTKRLDLFAKMDHGNSRAKKALIVRAFVAGLVPLPAFRPHTA
jgi:hypothetical protein